MDSRRDFLKKAALLSGAAMWQSVPASVRKALEIDPEFGSTFLDAEHVVILMQENRSFDHAFGALRGVRGLNDPRAHVLPNGNPVYFQTNAAGETYAPFRLDMKETNVTWTGGLPHSWGNQVDARNDGRYDKWLVVKPSGHKGLAGKPMTLGHYTRQDIPFYYSFADAFTICDQHFCSSLTGTYPNRFYLWTGNIRPALDPAAKAHVYNEEMDHNHEVDWTTFPDRLEDAGISWKIYQNELDLATGLGGEETYWLSNFGCNPIEFVSHFNVRFSPRYRAYLEKRIATLPVEIGEAREKVSNAGPLDADREKARKRLAALEKELSDGRSGLDKWSAANWDALSEREKGLHAKAFTVNEGDPGFRDVEPLAYDDGGVRRTMNVPKGDVFHQFRKDVESGNLPTVSWLVSPEAFSDHPSSAWYGAWFVSETLDILTQNPEVWKKTIFILTYDENDGYFDHVPPFVAPNPYEPNSGKVSDDLDAKVEFITREQDLAFRPGYKPRQSSIGLGYRVPLVVASPWSRGGCVCSQVFDHTSVLQFLEKFLTHKTGKTIRETNISDWRRAVCGDLTSIFQPFDGKSVVSPVAVPRNEFVEGIHRAQFKSLPTGFRALSDDEMQAIRLGRKTGLHADAQETGVRKSCPLPYDLYVDGGLSEDGASLELRFKAGKSFGGRSAGSPFNVYTYFGTEEMQFRAYAVSAGKEVQDSWRLSDFGQGEYHVRVDGPNGFVREFRGVAGEPRIEVTTRYGRRRRLEIEVVNHGSSAISLELTDHAYGEPTLRKEIAPKGRTVLTVDTEPRKGWYDLSVRFAERPSFVRRFGGRIENGQWSISDPAMGK